MGGWRPLNNSCLSLYVLLLQVCRIGVPFRTLLIVVPKSVVSDLHFVEADPSDRRILEGRLYYLGRSLIL